MTMAVGEGDLVSLSLGESAGAADGAGDIGGAGVANGAGGGVVIVVGSCAGCW